MRSAIESWFVRLPSVCDVSVRWLWLSNSCEKGDVSKIFILVSLTPRTLRNTSWRQTSTRREMTGN